MWHLVRSRNRGGQLITVTFRILEPHSESPLARLFAPRRVEIAQCTTFCCRSGYLKRALVMDQVSWWEYNMCTFPQKSEIVGPTSRLSACQLDQLYTLWCRHSERISPAWLQCTWHKISGRVVVSCVMRRLPWNIETSSIVTVFINS